MPEYVGQVRREKKRIVFLASLPSLALRFQLLFNCSCVQCTWIRKSVVRFPYNQLVLTRGFKNVVELSKIYSQLRPLCKFDTSGDWFREKIAKAVLSVVSVYNVVFSGGSNMSRWKWQYADKACSCLSKREKAEPSASDNCRICSCCFKTQFGNFKSGWISSENMFVAPTST